MAMRVSHLLLKLARGEPLTSVESVEVSESGMVGNVTCPPFRQVLLLPRRVLDRFELAPGDLRENIVIDGDRDIHDYPSGTVLQIGTARIRLTFHCEPCKSIRGKVRLRDVMHTRGYLGAFINKGKIEIGDQISLLGRLYEEIPYDIRHRIRWYLAKQQAPVSATKLVWDVGLSISYCRVIPQLLKRMPDVDPRMVYFATSTKKARPQPARDAEGTAQPKLISI